MTAHTALATELHLVLASAEADAAVYRAMHERGAPIQFGTLEDHRTAVLGELLSAMDRAEPGLGTRFYAAMHPTTKDEENEAEGAQR